MELHFLAVCAEAFQVVWHNGVAQSQSGESGRFREAAEFDGTLPCSGDLIYAVGHVSVGYVCFVGRVEEYQGVVGQGVVDPHFELLPVEGGAGGIVGVAEIDHVGDFVGEFGDESVLFRAWEIDDAVPEAVFG